MVAFAYVKWLKARLRQKLYSGCGLEYSNRETAAFRSRNKPHLRPNMWLASTLPGILIENGGCLMNEAMNGLVERRRTLYIFRLVF